LRGFLVVDVKPPDLFAEPQVAEAVDWCRRLCADKAGGMIGSASPGAVS